MPTPEREVRYPSPSGVPMKDLLASCAAASAVSTPPSPAPGAPADDARAVTGDDAAFADRAHGNRPPARREAA